jgi:uncharacterized protein YukE
MRYQDFKRKMFEEKQDELKNDLDTIGKEIASAEKTDANLALKAKQLLQQLINQANNYLNKVSASQFNEDVVTYSLIDELNSTIAEICDTVPNCDPIVQKFRDKVAKLKQTLEGAFEKTHAAGRKQAEKQAVDFMNAIDEQLARLAQKIDGHVVKDWQAPDPQTGKKMATADKKKEITRQKTQDALMDLFDTLFRRKIKTGELKQQEALNFAKAAADGKVINMLNLVGAARGHGKIDDYVNPKFQKVYNIIIDDLLNSMPAGTGGNVGPGELALAALGNPTEKAIEKGDLIIGDEAYEIKGGNFAKGQTSSGGRLNSTKIADGKGAYSNIQKTLKNDHPDVWAALRELRKDGSLKGKDIISGFTQQGVKNYELALNKAGYRKPQAVEFFEDLIKDIVMNYQEVMDSREDQTYHNILDNAIRQDKNGISISFEDLRKAITFVQYKSYNLADGVEKILLLNKGNRTFTIINDAADFLDKIDSGHAVPVKSLSITSSDPQTASFHWTSK